MWQYDELGDERRPAARCRVCKSCGGSNKASYNATHLIWHFKAEYKVYRAVTAWKAGLKLQTLLTRFGKHNLCCYRLLQIIFIHWAKYAVAIKLWRRWELLSRLDHFELLLCLHIYFVSGFYCICSYWVSEAFIVQAKSTLCLPSRVTPSPSAECTF